MQVQQQGTTQVDTDDVCLPLDVEGYGLDLVEKQVEMHSSDTDFTVFSSDKEIVESDSALRGRRSAFLTSEL